MEGPERVICCSLCLCMAVAVFSSVALVYLTALVYMPAKREIASGLSDVPVVCTTVERAETDDCDWVSCGEWCLSRSSHCVKLWASVRKNGTDLELRGCDRVTDITCPVLDSEFVHLSECERDSDCASVNARFMSKCNHNKCYISSEERLSWAGGGADGDVFKCDEKSHKCVSRRQFRNCKKDRACVDLEAFWQCQDGLCQNISSVYQCYFDGDTAEPALDCKDKRNCITLNGFYHCSDGQCSKLSWPWQCERRCGPAVTSSPHNVVFLSGDRILSARCAAAVATDEDGESVLWGGGDGRSILMASCTEMATSTGNGAAIAAKDCVNGSLIPRSYFPDGGVANYTVVHDVFERVGIYFALDRGQMKIPFEQDITIYERTKLLINTEACVNTLQYECTEFYLDHRRDGRNQTARDRFPCYYTPRHGDYAVTRFSLEKTRYAFFLFFSVPACLWVLSCSCLFACSKLLRVEDNGQMRIRCRRPLTKEEREKRPAPRRRRSQRCRSANRRRSRRGDAAVNGAATAAEDEEQKLDVDLELDDDEDEEAFLKEA